MIGNISILRLLIDFILAILAAALFEIFKILEDIFHIVIVFIVALSVLILLDRHLMSRKMKKKFLAFEKRSDKLRPQDFRLAKYNEYFYKNTKFESISRALTEKKNVLITGKPKAGKTRAAYEAMKIKKNFKVIKFKETLIEISEIPNGVFKGKLIVFIDDVNKYLKNLDFNELIEKLKLESKEFIILATCRSGEEYESTQEVLGDYISNFEIIKLNDVTEDEALNVVKKANVELKHEEFDGSIGSLFLGNKEMKKRFKHLHEESKVLFKMLKLLIDAGIFSPKKEILETLYLSELRRQEMKSNLMFESSLNFLEDNSFIAEENEGINPLHDSYLDFLDYNATKADLKRLEEILIQNKYVYELYRLGVTFSYKGWFNDAISCYDESLKINPNFAFAWNDKGVVFGKLRKDDEALKYYNKALKINPNYAIALLNKGSSLANLNKVEEALECFDKSVEIAPNFPEAWLHKGKAMGALAKNNEERHIAIQALDNSLELNPSLAEAFFEKGLLIGLSGKNDIALKCFDNALAKNPDLLKVWITKIVSLELEGKFEEANKCQEQMLKIHPDFNFDDLDEDIFR